MLTRTGGLGSSIGKKLRQQGARLAILYAPFEASHRDEFLATRYADDSSTAANPLEDIHTYECDITSPESVENAFSTLEKELVTSGLSAPSILINTAGYVSSHDMESTPPEETMKHLTTNVYGPMLCSQAFAKLYFAARKAAEEKGQTAAPGRIVNVASQAAHIALPMQSAYCASKAALLGLTRSMASEWAGRGITANSVSPTVAWTALAVKAWGDESVRDAFQKAIPTGRFAQPDEVADSVIFLCQVCFFLNPYTS